MYTRVGIKDSIWSSLLCWSTSLSHDMSLLSSLIIRTNWAILTPCTGNSVHSTSALWDSTDRSDTFHEESSVTANVEMRWKETPLDTCASYTIEKKPVADLVQLCLEMSLPGSYQYQDVFKMLDHRAAAWSTHWTYTTWRVPWGMSRAWIPLWHLAPGVILCSLLVVIIIVIFIMFFVFVFCISKFQCFLLLLFFFCTFILFHICSSQFFLQF